MHAPLEAQPFLSTFLAGSEPDFVDALAVVLDMYIKTIEKRALGDSVTKKVVLISNFRAQVGMICGLQSPVMPVSISRTSLLLEGVQVAPDTTAPHLHSGE
jgi:hypothetical protein